MKKIAVILGAFLSCLFAMVLICRAARGQNTSRMRTSTATTAKCGTAELAWNAHTTPFLRTCPYKDIVGLYLGSFPQGVSASPDGSSVLLRKLTDKLHLGLDIVDIASQKLRLSYASESDVVRPTWSSNSQEIAFFELQSGELFRVLRLWDLTTGNVVTVPGIKSYAESQVSWSPNSMMVAFSDPDKGLLVVKKGEKPIVTELLTKEPLTFEWSPDSNVIIAIPSDTPNTLLEISVETGATKTHLLPDREVGRGISWYSGHEQPIVRTKNSNTKSSSLMLFDLDNDKTATVYHSTSDVRDPQWTDKGHDLVFPIQSEWGRELYRLNLNTNEAEQITHFGGWTDFRGKSDTDDKLSIGSFTASGSDLFLLNGVSGKTQLVYHDPTADLLVTEGKRVVSTNSSGRRLSGVLWVPQSSAKGLIIELHNMSGSESNNIYAYDAEYARRAELANHEGYAFLYVDCYSTDILAREGLPNASDFGVRLSQLADEVGKSLSVSSQNVLLIAYSVGANATLSFLADAPTAYGSVVLVGLSEERAEQVTRRLPFSNSIKLALVETTLDPEGTSAGLSAVRSALLDYGVHPELMETLLVPDVHLLIHPTSWLSIQSLVYGLVIADKRSVGPNVIEGSGGLDHLRR